jgi:hypothetical protein
MQLSELHTSGLFRQDEFNINVQEINNTDSRYNNYK